jgi:hypothetical protein
LSIPSWSPARSARSSPLHKTALPDTLTERAKCATPFEEVTDLSSSGC